MGHGGHLFLLIGPKNTDLVKDVKILLPVKFRRILFSGFREEVENVSASQRPGRSSYFSDLLEKHRLSRGHIDLASCQVLLNSVQRFQRRSRKCLSQSEARAAILFFRSARKNTNLVEGIEILLFVKFIWILFSGFRGEVENVKVYAGRTDGRQDGALWQQLTRAFGSGELKSCLALCHKLIYEIGIFHSINWEHVIKILITFFCLRNKNLYFIN